MVVSNREIKYLLGKIFAAISLILFGTYLLGGISEVRVKDELLFIGCIFAALAEYHTGRFEMRWKIPFLAIAAFLAISLGFKAVGAVILVVLFLVIFILSVASQLSKSGEATPQSPDSPCPKPSANG